jgi:hypothetical protein
MSTSSERRLEWSDATIILGDTQASVAPGGGSCATAAATSERESCAPLDDKTSDAAADAVPSMSRPARVPLGRPGEIVISPMAARSYAGEAGATVASSTASSNAQSRSGRFILLALCVAVAASLGAVGGSLGIARFARFLPVASLPAVHADTRDEVGVLKDALAHVRMNVKVLSDSVSALRVTISTSNAATSTQLTRLNEALDRIERAQSERRAAASSPETTGYLPPQSAAAAETRPGARPAIVEGWTLRKVYDGTALIEGRYGIVEVEPGAELPGLGRIQEIRRQDGRWVVVTPRGLILPIR